MLDDTLCQPETRAPSTSQHSVQAKTVEAFLSATHALGWLMQRGGRWVFDRFNTLLAVILLAVTYFIHVVDALLPS